MVWSARTDDGVRTRTLRRGEGARLNGARACTMHDAHAQLAVHAELAANGTIQYSPGRAPRSTAAAWDKRETIAW